MRDLGYNPRSLRFRLKDINQPEGLTQKVMAKSKQTSAALSELNELKEKYAQLERALVQSELRATAFETMIEVAEKELKISIRKKSYTKQSI
jgi:septal ring factor EnvC (AmiA/AmiB activator)